MNDQCPKCKKGTLNPIGIGCNNDAIAVQCNKCNEIIELELNKIREGKLKIVDIADAILAEFEK